MTDLDALREQVKSEAEDAVNEQLGRVAEESDDSGGSGGGDAGVLSSSEIASRGWELSDYNSFFSDCRKDGYGASDCGAMWTAAKESGLVDTGSVQPADSDDSDSVDDGQHVLMLKEGAESSDLTAQYLADPIMDGEIDVVAVESDVGQNILESLDDVPPVPAHLMMDGDAVEVRDLETLFDTYTDPA